MKHSTTMALLCAMLVMAAAPAAQVAASPQFKAHCAGCHDSAADFAHQSLELQGGVLVAKASRKPVPDSLRSHGGLPPTEAPAMVQTLRRVLQEVGGS